MNQGTLYGISRIFLNFKPIYKYHPMRRINFSQFTFRPHQALGFTQPLTELSTRSRKLMFLGSKARPERKADNLTAIYEPIVLTMWDP
jgi:hypothetical protein